MAEKNFRKIYETELVPNLAKLEKTRKILHFCNRASWILGIVTVILIIVGVKSTGLFSKVVFIKVILFIITILIIRLVLAAKVSRFKFNFKVQVISPILKIVNPSFVYEAKGKVSKEEFVYSRICDPLLMNSMGRDVYRGEDLVSGSIENVQIRFSDLEYKTVEEYEEKNDETGKYEKRTREYQIYKGQFFVMQFPEEFKCSMLLLPEKLEHYYGGIGTTFQQWGITVDAFIQIEESFDKKFAAYTNHENAHEDIITSDIRTTLLNFVNTQEHDLLLTINENKLHFALRGLDSFEPSLKESILDFEKMELFYLELEFATKFAHQLANLPKAFKAS